MRIDYAVTPRDVLFFRDARPMDSEKARLRDVRLIGHGAVWPRPDLLHSAVIHALLGGPDAPETDYGSVPDLRVAGPFPVREGRLFLPRPLDWDMTVEPVPAGLTDLPAPLTHGFVDRVQEKKRLPAWVDAGTYARYLRGEIRPGEQPPAEPLWQAEPRVGTTLDRETGCSRRTRGKVSGQWQMEVLRLEPGVAMLCAVEQARADALDGRDVRLGGQGGTVRFARVPEAEGLMARLRRLPRGTPTRWLRWTLLTPALFMKGWLPNWLDGAGRVMLPFEAVERRVGETREAWRRRARTEWKPFPTARLAAARIDTPIAFSGWDALTHAKPTELAVPAGSAYLFRCDTAEEAARLAELLHLRTRSDLGEKGFGLGVCAFLPDCD